jgi:D-sedoheptulose 7-phosphate isomerase
MINQDAEMTPQDLINQAIAEHQNTIERVIELVPLIESLAVEVRASLKNGGKILFMGNGGSAADCQHLAAEFVGRYQRERRGLAAIALTTDTSILTSVGNDLGFEQIFARQVEALCKAGDVLVGISTSGNSRNILTGMEIGKQLGAFTVGLLGGNGGAMLGACDLAVVVPSSHTPRIQEAHILIGHILCELVERNDVG